ncbi:MAG: helix-turn-helix transcriptional regulator [Vulcanimicrobiaceae bacterium]
MQRLTLTESDYRASLEAVADICSQRDPERYRSAVVDHLMALVPSDVVSYNLFGPSGLIAVDRPSGTCTPALLSALSPLLKDHALISYALSSGDARPYRLSDFGSQRQFAATALYADFYTKLGLRSEIAFAVKFGAHVLAIGLDRTGGDYSDREFELVRLVAPHIIAAHRNLWEIENLRVGEAAALTGSLTAREREVLASASLGKTNPEIAVALSISARTVQKHLENVFRKLSVHRRTAAAAALPRGGVNRSA